MRTITVEDFRAELKAQGVRSHEHFAFRCVMCGTVQSKQIAKSNHVRDRHINARPTPRQVLIGTRASGVRIPLRGGPPVDRRTGLPLWRPRA